MTRDVPDYTQHANRIHLIGGLDRARIDELIAANNAWTEPIILSVLDPSCKVTIEYMRLLDNYDWLRANYSEGAD